MLVKLHANATAEDTGLYPEQHGLGRRTCRRTRRQRKNHPSLARTQRHRGSLAPGETHGHQPPSARGQALSPLEEALVCELRTILDMPLDEIVETMRRCLNAKLSRSAIHRRRPKPAKPAVGRFEEAPIGFIHACPREGEGGDRSQASARPGAAQNLRLRRHRPRDPLCLSGEPSSPRRQNRRRFPPAVSQPFPAKPHTILTDGANVYRERQALTMGSEFTDRFPVDPRIRFRGDKHERQA